MADFEDIRLKEVEDLTDEDKGVIKEHAADLSDEEKEYARQFIPKGYEICE